MSANDLDAKNRIIKAAMELLEEEKDTGRITVRRIAEKAGVGIGLVNYHFKSKDNLLNESVNITMAEMADKLREVRSDEGAAPVERLKSMLKQLSGFAMKYYKLMQISLNYELLHGDLQVPYYILPILREIFGKGKDERELRLIAFQLITSMQVVLLRADTFLKYSGINIFDEAQRNESIDMMIDSIIKN